MLPLSGAELDATVRATGRGEGRLDMNAMRQMQTAIVPPAGFTDAQAMDYRRGVADAVCPPTDAEIHAAPFVPLSDAYAKGYRDGTAAMRRASSVRT